MINDIWIYIAIGALILAALVTFVAVKKHSLDKRGDLANHIEDSEEIDESDKQLLKSAIEFGEMFTREVMVPRTDMITLDSKDTYDSALKLFIRSGFSRIPVLGQSADEVVGIAYFKDIVEEIYSKNSQGSTPITKALRESLFVPESKPVDDLFRMMQVQRQHIALVIDEYGGIAGLVTIEDALEEIVGELDDEHDTHSSEDVEIERSADGEVTECTLPARYLISDLEELYDVLIEHDDVDTILGLLNREIGRVAIKGSWASIAGLRLEAVSTSGRRKQVSKIFVTRLEEDDNE